MLTQDYWQSSQCNFTEKAQDILAKLINIFFFNLIHIPGDKELTREAMLFHKILSVVSPDLMSSELMRLKSWTDKEIEKKILSNSVVSIVPAEGLVSAMRCASPVMTNVGSHISVGSDNGLAPVWHQAIIWTNAGPTPLGNSCWPHDMETLFHNTDPLWGESTHCWSVDFPYKRTEMASCLFLVKNEQIAQ